MPLQYKYVPSKNIKKATWKHTINEWQYLWILQHTTLGEINDLIYPCPSFYTKWRDDVIISRLRIRYTRHLMRQEEPNQYQTMWRSTIHQTYS